MMERSLATEQCECRVLGECAQHRGMFGWCSLEYFRACKSERKNEQEVL